MDPYFRSAHGSNPSPHDESSPHSATSQYRPFPGTSGLDRLLQSPQDMMRYNKGLDRYSVPANKPDEVKGYDGYQYGQAQASGSQSQQQAGQAGTGKRGSKACVACKFLISTRLNQQVEKGRTDVKEIHQGSMAHVEDVSATTYHVFTRRPEIGAKEEVARAGQRGFLAMRRAGFLSWRTLFAIWHKGRVRSRTLYAKSYFH